MSSAVAVSTCSRGGVHRVPVKVNMVVSLSEYCSRGAFHRVPVEVNMVVSLFKYCNGGMFDQVPSPLVLVAEVFIECLSPSVPVAEGCSLSAVAISIRSREAFH